MIDRQPNSKIKPSRREEMRDYLFDMISQLAQLARDADETQVAIHLEAIIAAQRAIPKDLSAESRS